MQLITEHQKTLKTWVRASLPEWSLAPYRAIRDIGKEEPIFPFETEVLCGDRSGKFLVEDSIEYGHTKPGYEANFHELFFAAVQYGYESPNVIVIGAAEGAYAVGAALHRARVVAFEPEEKAFAKMKHNVALNRSNIMYEPELVKGAVSENDGIVMLHTDSDRARVGRIMADKVFNEAREVKSFALDSLLGNDVIRQCDVMLIDVEGAEMLALKGMEKLLASTTRPHEIFVELHVTYLREFNSSAEEVVGFLNKFGYRLTWQQLRGDQVHALFVDY